MAQKSQVGHQNTSMLKPRPLASPLFHAQQPLSAGQIRARGRKFDVAAAVTGVGGSLIVERLMRAASTTLDCVSYPVSRAD